MDTFDVDMFAKPAEDPLKVAVTAMMWHKYNTTARHVQIELGPSELGEPCIRKLAYNAMHHEGNHRGDPLPSIVGTAAHTWMAEACDEWNRQAGQIIWLPEMKLDVAAGIFGHSDAYHLPTQTVVDWKFPGTDQLKKYVKNGPSDLYRKQGHLYGRGWAAKGFPVATVAIVFLPRGGFLTGMHVFSEPYDPQVADDALKRYYDITELAIELDVHSHPARYTTFAKVPGHHCGYCKWFKPTNEDTGITCPGYTKD